GRYGKLRRRATARGDGAARSPEDDGSAPPEIIARYAARPATRLTGLFASLPAVQWTSKAAMQLLSRDRSLRRLPDGEQTATSNLGCHRRACKDPKMQPPFRARIGHMHHGCLGSQ